MASSGSMLYLPFRRTQTMCISEAIKRYISTRYNQAPDLFAGDLEAVNQLRMAAVQAVEPHTNNVRKLQVYAAQLAWLEEKLPKDIGAEFTWYPAIGYNTKNPSISGRLRFEYANVLFNLAALYSQLGVFTNRTTSEGLRKASNFFCLSAGVISYLKMNVISDLESLVPEDMDQVSLESVEKLLLAQAQECFWQKAVKDGLKDASVARLAAMVSDYYAEAGDYGVKSDSITSEWIHHSTAKHYHFAAAAQYRAACDCLEKRKYGEEVARLRDSLTCVNEALHEVRYVSKVVAGDLNGLKNRLQEDLKRAEKDNDLIYLQPVPPQAELKALDRASMVSPKMSKEMVQPILTLNESNELGQPLFNNLVPYSVHVAADNYASRKNYLVKTTIIDKLEYLNAELQEVVKSLNLPGALLSIEKPMGIPAQVKSHALEIRNEGGISRLNDMVQDTTDLKESDKTIFEEGCSILLTEATEDEQARRRHGTERWTRLSAEEAAPKLFAQKQEIQAYLTSAENSDQLVEVKLRENEKAIALLSGTDQNLEAFLTSSAKVAVSPRTEAKVKAVRDCLNIVSQIAGRWERIMETYRTMSKMDDINGVILKETARFERENPDQRIEAIHFDDIFDERLRKYDKGKDVVREEKEVQMELISQLRETHAAFAQAKKEDASNRKREEELQRLETGYVKYNEIISNLEVGRQFYKDLAKIVVRFRDECSVYARQRNVELRQLESDISSMMSVLSLKQNPIATRDPHNDKNSAMPSKKYEAEGVPSAAKDVKRSNGPIMGMWAPEMGIKFADAGFSSERAKADHSQDARWNPSKGMRFS